MKTKFKIIYFCIVSVLSLYGIGYENTIIETYSGSSLCNLVKQNYKLSITGLHTVDHIQRNLNAISDPHFFFNLTFKIRPENLLNFYFGFKATKDSNINTHEVTSKVRNSMTYEFVPSISYSLLLSANHVLTKVGMNNIDNSNQTCLLKIRSFNKEMNVILFKYETDVQLYLMPLVRKPSSTTNESSTTTQIENIDNLEEIVLKVHLEQDMEEVKKEIAKGINVAVVAVTSILVVVVAACV